MKVITQVKLILDETQREALLATMKAFNAAATLAAQIGFQANKFAARQIQNLCYKTLRNEFRLKAQMAVRAAGKAAEVFRRDQSICPRFRPLGAMTYDDGERGLSWKHDRDSVSISTLNGCIKVPYRVGVLQRERLRHVKGQVDLVYSRGSFYLHATTDLPEVSAKVVHDLLGVDLGMVHLATDSMGKHFSGAAIERNRKRRMRARQQYQRRGTRNAKRRLRKMSGRQHRFQTWTNHNISKELVGKAKALQCGIAMEDLTFIRDRIEETVGRKHRQRLGNWSFAQLRAFVEYKAELEGVPFVSVDPRNSSRTCHKCDYCDKANRKSQSEFVCRRCGHSMNADVNAALNLRVKGLGQLGNCPQKARRSAAAAKPPATTGGCFPPTNDRADCE